MKKILYLIFLLFFSSIALSHDGHPFIEVKDNYELISKVKAEYSLRISFENDKLKDSALKELEKIKNAVSYTFKTACYDIETKRGINLLEADILFHLDMIEIQAEEIILRKNISLFGQ